MISITPFPYLAIPSLPRDSHRLSIIPKLIPGMSRVLDVPPELGQRMLRGWILTDNICTKCNKLPKMRSPARHGSVAIEECVSCDGENAKLGGIPIKSLAAENRQSVVSLSSEPDSALSLIMSGHSTPPTEVSSTLSSPTFAVPVDTEDILRRRQQSDRASTEIGNRLLRGWAMLADECPGETCFGVPLVRPPKPGGGKDPRKECVICGTTYVDEKDSNGWDRLVRMSDLPGPSSEPTAAQASASDRAKGKGISSNETPNALPPTPINAPKHAQSKVTGGTPASGRVEHEPFVTSKSTTDAALEAANSALEKALHALSRRLTSLASELLVVDPASISQTADAITKVSAAMTQVKQLQWSEKGARNSIY